MTGEKGLFTTLELHDIHKETIVFGDNNKGDVIGLGKIAISNNTSISNVYLVESLRYNLLSVLQLYEMGYNCLFTNVGVIVFRREDFFISFTGRSKGKLYLVDFSRERVEPKTCLVAKSNLGWLWHRRLAHVGMRNLAKLQKSEHILGQTNVVFEKDRICTACQVRKQVGARQSTKNIMTSSNH
jgi:hypothetical protein